MGIILYMTLLVAKYDVNADNSMYSLIVALLCATAAFSLFVGFTAACSLFASGPFFFFSRMLKCHLWSYDVHIFCTVPGDSNTGDHGNSQENLVKQFQNLIAPLLCLAFIFSPIFVGPHDQKQVTVFPYSFSSRFIGF